MSFIGRTVTAVEAMRLAIAEAEKGWGRVAPNPLVGCVIVDKEHRVLAVGHHAEYGSAHAEVAALTALGAVKSSGAGTTEIISPLKSLEGATVYVTLEPCAHVGKTGSCAQALIKHPIAKVVYGLIDPNPLVAGKGIRILEEIGIETELATAAHPELLAPLEQLCEHFLWNQRQNLPYVALKAATTLDGMIASREGVSKWISNEDSRGETHRLRTGFDAVLVGKNTFLNDNPSLDARYPTARPTNFAIVLDSKGEALSKLKGSRLLQVRPASKIVWIVDDASKFSALGNELGIQIVQGPIDKALGALMALGIRSIFVEGGATVHSYFIDKKLAQRLYLFLAPQIAGADGMHWTQRFSPGGWDSRIRLRDVKVRSIDQDVYWTALF